jgi:hypothetical protein
VLQIKSTFLFPSGKNATKKWQKNIQTQRNARPAQPAVARESKNMGVPAVLLPLLNQAASAASDALASVGLGEEARAHFGVTEPLASLGIPQAFQALAICAALSLILTSTAVVLCCRARTRAQESEPLLPSYTMRSDEPRHCRAAAYCAAASNGSALPDGAASRAAAATIEVGGAAVAPANGLCGGRGYAEGGASSAQGGILSGILGGGAGGGRGGTHPQERPEERTVTVSDVVTADAEGGRGGGWGDLDGMPEELTLQRREHPTSRRGADLADARKRDADEMPMPRRGGGAGAMPPHMRRGGGGGDGSAAPRGCGGGRRR